MTNNKTISITFSDLSSDVAAQLVAFFGTISGVTDSADASEPAKGKRGRKPLAVVQDDESDTGDSSDDTDTDGDADTEEDEDDDSDSDSDDEEDEDDSDADEEDEAPKKKAKTSKSVEDVIPVFKKYAAKHGREKAVKVLKKLGVKTVRELKVGQVSQALKLLK